MFTFERIQVYGTIGSITRTNGQRTQYFKLSLTPGSRTVRGEKVQIWYSIFVPFDRIRDHDTFERMHRVGRKIAVDGKPIMDVWSDKTTGEPRGEITIMMDTLPVLLDSADSRATQG